MPQAPRINRRHCLGAAALATTGLLVGCAATPDVRSDHARERRWRAEYEPGLVLGEVIELQGLAGAPRFAAIWTPAATGTSLASAGVVLLHGIGTHPDHGLTGHLRQSLADQGFATLSIQAPILDMTGISDAGIYSGLMPDAIARIESAIAELRRRGLTRAFGVGHTTGSWMLNEFLRRSSVPMEAWAALGHTGNLASLGSRRVATLDVTAGRGVAVALRAAPQRAALIEQWDARSRQLLLPNADLSFDSERAAVAQAIGTFFKGIAAT
jgi:hypothetical protein